jgi:hypothetical protein
MANDAELVAIRVSEVSAVVVGMILRPKAWLALARAAIRQCNSICTIYDFASAGQERGHLTIAGIMGLLVVRALDNKQWPGIRRRLPTRPGVFGVYKSRINAERFHQGAVESHSPIKIADADYDVGEHPVVS